MTKSNNDYEFEGFSTRSSFNRSLGHFRSVNTVVEDLTSKVNLADSLQELLNSKEMEVHQILPVVQSVLVDKFKYQSFSCNLPKTYNDLSFLSDELLKWNSFDIVAVYHHPESGVLVLNPKNYSHWESLGTLKANELISFYFGSFEKTEKLLTDKKFLSLIDSALKSATQLLQNSKIKTPAGLLEGNYKFVPPKKVSVKTKSVTATKTARSKKTPVTAEVIQTIAVGTSGSPSAVAAPNNAHLVQKAPAPLGGRMAQSPKVGIQVTNELFHNGNVEAWKRIIDSYKVKYPNTRVIVYYDGEVIHDINSLFKWGKVKHGTSIYFSLAAATAEDIKDISKIRKYLLEGASPRFEQFLRGPVGKILELF